MPFQISLNTHKTVLWLSNFRGLSSGKNVTLHIKIVRGTPLINIYLTHTRQKKTNQTYTTIFTCLVSCQQSQSRADNLSIPHNYRIYKHTQPIKVHTHTHTQYTENNNNKHLPQSATFMRNKKKKHLNSQEKKTKNKSLVFSINFYPPFCILYNWFFLLLFI